MRVFARIFIPAWLLIACSVLPGYAQNDVVSKAFLMGKINYMRDTSFTKVDKRYTDREIYLKKETYSAYIKMYAAALKDGVQLTMISGVRSFYDQCCKWDGKWNAAEFSGIKNTDEKINRMLRWWSMPGTSRHHWGTDMDLTNIKPAWYNTVQGIKTYNWLVKYAAAYGFYQPFNANRPVGYQEEKWHWSYVPLARIYLREYLKEISYTDFAGFYGYHSAQKMDVIATRVSAINPACK
ncbi:MAG: M15 family metallopeptidase [Bacteroidota bacterium]